MTVPAMGLPDTEWARVVDGLGLGDHAMVLYSDFEGLAPVAVRFMVAGLRDNEYVVALLPLEEMAQWRPLFDRALQATEGLEKSGTLQIIPLLPSRLTGDTGPLDLVPLMRRQMVSMRQMQAIGPEIKEIQRRFKNDRLKAQQAQSALMKERGISQAGCLVAMLPLFLILPMYQVVREGLTAADITPMLTVFGFKVLPVVCDPGSLAPCLDPHVPWLGGINAALFEGMIPLPFELPILGAGISMFAIVYTFIQLAASRMALPPHTPGAQLDQSARTQRAMAIWLPLITILYGSVIPVGVFIYLIVSTIYQVFQQFLTTGWGGMFPLFGWSPGFAVDHKPRFPVAMPTAPVATSRPAGAPARSKPERPALDRSASAESTIRRRGRQGRRGRRR